MYVIWKEGFYMRHNKKGFTLVEVIVVLVILAVIIALAVPSVMKYINDAQDAKYLANARAVNQEVITYTEKEMIKNPNFSSTIVTLKQQLSFGSKNILNKIIETEEVAGYKPYSIDLSFDKKYSDNGWDYDNKKEKHRITKICIRYSKIIVKNGVETLDPSDSVFVVTLINKKSYFYDDMDEINDTLDKEEGIVIGR